MPQETIVPADQHGLPPAMFTGPRVDTTCNGHYIDPARQRERFILVLGLEVVRKKDLVPIKTLHSHTARLR